jgi:hypothetical protein
LQGYGLDGITNLGTSAMGFYISGILGRNAGSRVDVADQLLLSFPVWRRDACIWLLDVV